VLRKKKNTKKRLYVVVECDATNCLAADIRAGRKKAKWHCCVCISWLQDNAIWISLLSWYVPWIFLITMTFTCVLSGVRVVDTCLLWWW